MKMKNKETFDQKYLQRLENIEFQPVFILGLHRSGTSILYKMLTSTDAFNSVTAYHLIKYDQLLSNHINKNEEAAKTELNNFLKERGQTDRGIDKLKINAEFAEEYGFVLGQKTNQMHITTKNLQLFIELAKKIQFISENKKPILLKNPYDLSNFLYIRKIFPNAKFIFIHRHPFKTLSSLNKAVKLLYKQRNPYTSLLYRDYNTVYENPILLYPFRFIISNYSPFGTIYLTMFSANSVKQYMKNIHKLPEKHYISITYEKLCKNPQNTMAEILQFLKIKTENIDFTSFINPRKTNLDPNVIKLQKLIYTAMKNYFDYFQYKPDINSL